jgi:predicted RND superfamily exporter protein
MINIETNLIDYFKEGSEIKEDAIFFDKHLGGATTLEISIKSEQPDFFKNPENLQIIEEIDTFTSNFEYIKKSTSVNTFIKQMNQAFHNNQDDHYRLPMDRNLIAQYLLLYDGKEMSYLINEQFNWARISYKINEHRSSEIKVLIDRLNGYFTEQHADSGVTFEVTGKTSLVNKLVKSIVDSQISSLSFAILIIIGCLILFFKSVKLGLLSVIPNLFPIIINFGIMGFFNIPLNTATAIISAIAIGIAVDDTIHYLAHYQEKRASGVNKSDAALSAIKEKGTAIISTSLILTGAFAILCISNFVPTIHFGFLCSTIMISAILGDLAILPSSIIFFNKATITNTTR